MIPMFLLAIAIAFALFVAVLIGRAIVQYSAYEKITPGSTESNLPDLVVIVPARNEENNIEPCLQSLLAQDYPADRLRIIVVDDNSTDSTAEQAARLASGFPRLDLLAGAPLRDGWKGKPFACWQAAQEAVTSTSPPAWLCFIDADTRAQPALLRSALRTATSRNIDMLSLEPFQELLTFWERLIIPAGFFLLAFSQDLRRVNDPHCPDAFANGQFILIRREVYQAVGGHAAIGNAISEDTALARRVKHAGHHLAVLGAESLITPRMYTSLDELWQGISINLVIMVGGTPRTILFALVGIALGVGAVALPIVGWMHAGNGIHLAGALFASIASLALFGVHIGAAVYFRIPFRYGLLFPLAYLVGAVLAGNSVLVRARNRIPWKDRIYADPASSGDAISHA
jgi:chlorobactene glucosyltransferase